MDLLVLNNGTLAFHVLGVRTLRILLTPSYNCSNDLKSSLMNYNKT